ncbi:hypothetical protein GGX14DRAFT_647776 [Mycena pura]|uniref:HAT C-terminal dimerisation domain-containing protein n=1 Tax=Mycena pura TaxID=153505 RepID=A0AAD6V7C6_9AGAR|nr:hypothetical protein GGX14DRAFT_647776 [Mycena pura]
MLAATIPAFELFIKSWKSMKADVDLRNQNVRQLIAPGLTVAESYYNKMGETDVYIISMFINPSIRFAWIRNHWTPDDSRATRGKSNFALEKLEEYDTINTGSESSSPDQPGSRQGSRNSSHTRTPAASAIAKAAQRYRSMSIALEFSVIGGQKEPGQWSAAEKMENYISTPCPPRASIDMLGYWASIGAQTWPRIYRHFLDYAPVQATSTDTKRRNRISPMLMEALQMLKFNFKKNRLNFMTEFQSTPEFDPEED